MKKKVLVLGATGAMGTYLVPELLKRGYYVDGVSMDEIKSDNLHLNYIKADAGDDKFLEKLLENSYDGIVDFMLYETYKFKRRYEMILKNTSHYMFLSSYRVYNDLDDMTSETSARLLETCDDKDFTESEDYSIIKARQEDILKKSGYNNWTILRPAITYSKRRFQLVTCEGNVIIPRAAAGKKILMPIVAKNVQATLTWAGDVAKMIAELLFSDNAKGEIYTPTTNEHLSWGEIADIYKDVLGLKTEWIDTDDYLKIMSGEKLINPHTRWQLQYDRLLNRVMDNEKVLKATGMKQSDLKSIRDGITEELLALPDDALWDGGEKTDYLMDEYIKDNL